MLEPHIGDGKPQIKRDIDTTKVEKKECDVTVVDYDSESCSCSSYASSFAIQDGKIIPTLISFN